MNYSTLVNYKRISPNCNKRVGKISKIAIHHAAVVNASLVGLGNGFANPARKASSNYGIDSNGKIGLYVYENYRAWTTGNNVDEDAITVEVANSTGSPNWEVSDKALQSLINLCIDICKRYEIKQLVFTGDKNNSNVILHKWYQPTLCPGPYLESKIPYIVEQVNSQLKNNLATAQKTIDELAKEVIRGLWGIGNDRKNRLTEAGYNYDSVQARVNELLGASKQPAAPSISFALGDKVKLTKDATYYDGKTIPFWVRALPLYVRDIQGDRIVISILKVGAITGAVRREHLTK